MPYNLPTDHHQQDVDGDCERQQLPPSETPESAYMNRDPPKRPLRHRNKYRTITGSTPQGDQTFTMIHNEPPPRPQSATNSSLPASTALPDPPAFSSFQFETIGQPPSFLNRLSDTASGQTDDHQYKSKSPPMEAPTSANDGIRSGRPSLLQTLGSVDTNMDIDMEASFAAPTRGLEPLITGSRPSEQDIPSSSSREQSIRAQFSSAGDRSARSLSQSTKSGSRVASNGPNAVSHAAARNSNLDIEVTEAHRIGQQSPTPDLLYPSRRNSTALDPLPNPNNFQGSQPNGRRPSTDNNDAPSRVVSVPAHAAVSSLTTSSGEPMAPILQKIDQMRIKLNSAMGRRDVTRAASASSTFQELPQPFPTSAVGHDANAEVDLQMGRRASDHESSRSDSRDNGDTVPDNAASRSPGENPRMPTDEPEARPSSAIDNGFHPVVSLSIHPQAQLESSSSAQIMISRNSSSHAEPSALMQWLDDASRARSDLQSLLLRTTSAESTAQSLATELDASKSEVAEAKAEAAQTAALLVTSKSDNAALQKDVAALRGEVASLQKLLRKQERKLQKELAEKLRIEGEANDLLGLASQCIESIEELRAKVGTNEAIEQHHSEDRSTASEDGRKHEREEVQGLRQLEQPGIYREGAEDVSRREQEQTEVEAGERKHAQALQDMKRTSVLNPESAGPLFQSSPGSAIAVSPTPTTDQVHGQSSRVLSPAQVQAPQQVSGSPFTHHCISREPHVASMSLSVGSVGGIGGNRAVGIGIGPAIGHSPAGQRATLRHLKASMPAIQATSSDLLPSPVVKVEQMNDVEVKMEEDELAPSTSPERSPPAPPQRPTAQLHVAIPAASHHPEVNPSTRSASHSFSQPLGETSPSRTGHALPCTNHAPGSTSFNTRNAQVAHTTNVNENAASYTTSNTNSPTSAFPTTARNPSDRTISKGTLPPPSASVPFEGDGGWRNIRPSDSNDSDRPPLDDYERHSRRSYTPPPVEYYSPQHPFGNASSRVAHPPSRSPSPTAHERPRITPKKRNRSPDGYLSNEEPPMRRPWQAGSGQNTFEYRGVGDSRDSRSNTRDLAYAYRSPPRATTPPSMTGRTVWVGRGESYRPHNSPHEDYDRNPPRSTYPGQTVGWNRGSPNPRTYNDNVYEWSADVPRIDNTWVSFRDRVQRSVTPRPETPRPETPPWPPTISEQHGNTNKALLDRISDNQRRAPSGPAFQGPSQAHSSGSNIHSRKSAHQNRGGGPHVRGQGKAGRGRGVGRGGGAGHPGVNQSSHRLMARLGL